MYVLMDVCTKFSVTNQKSIYTYVWEGLSKAGWTDCE